MIYIFIKVQISKGMTVNGITALMDLIQKHLQIFILFSNNLQLLLLTALYAQSLSAFYEFLLYKTK